MGHLLSVIYTEWVWKATYIESFLKMTFGTSGWLRWLRCLTPDFCSDHDLRILGLSPASGYIFGGKSVSFLLALPLPLLLLLPLPLCQCTCTLFKINLQKKKSHLIEHQYKVKQKFIVFQHIVVLSFIPKPFWNTFKIKTY